MLPNKRFQGIIAEKTLKSFLDELDFDLEKTEDRVKKVQGILQEQGKYKAMNNFFEKLFEQERKPKPFFDVNIGTTGHRSEETEVGKTLERIANYMLYNKEMLEINDVAEYPYMTNTDKKRTQKKEVSYETLAGSNNNTESEEKNIRMESIEKKIGTKKYGRISINNSDRDNISYINQLQKTIDCLLVKIESGKLDKQEEFKLKRIIVDLRREQVLIKIFIKKPIEFKAVMKDETKIDFDSDTGYYDEQGEYVEVSENKIDLTNPNHIHQIINKYSQLVESGYEDLNNDLRYIIWSLNEVIENANLSEVEKDITIKTIDGVKSDEILLHLNKEYSLEWTRKYLSKVFINSICKKIAKEYKRKYDDWFFLKSKYPEVKHKICSRCGEKKLANRNYFSVNKLGKDRLKSICKKCDGNKNKKNF